MLIVKTEVKRPSWRENLKARFKPTPRPVVQFDGTGTTVTVWRFNGIESKTELKWSEVNRVVAYKRDCYAHDLICMGFTTPDDGFIEVNEQDDGWDNLIEAVPHLLPGIIPSITTTAVSRQRWGVGAFAFKEAPFRSLRESHCVPTKARVHANLTVEAQLHHPSMRSADHSRRP